jgi:hypothetical protein
MTFLFKLETTHGLPANAFKRRSKLVPWRHDPFGHKTLRVVSIRDDDADQPPVLVVEEVAGKVNDDAN